ncbi:MAG: hypothetical protein M1838_002484 [Thelocarpon superellum]|nr:MAG: hypothetical protein M1838_002484 [Thelocarpon superellum]
MAGQNDPRLLYSIPNIRAFHIHNGRESPLTPGGPQTMSLLMVPTSSPFAGLSTSEPQRDSSDDDFYLHLHLPPELDLPLPATTQIYHQPPHSYLIPRWDLGPDSGAFTRIQFPSIGGGPDKVRQEDVDTFETILAQCTSFLERAAAPSTGPKHKSGKGHVPYNPQDYGPGEGYIKSEEPPPVHGHIVLVDEENGSVVGELSDAFSVVEDADLKAGSKQPVQIQLPQDETSHQIDVSNAPPDYLEDTLHPAYKDSALVAHAAMASRLIVTTSSHISAMLQSGADTFTQKVKPRQTPLTFTPTTHERVRKLNSLTQGAAGLSAKAVGQVNRYAQNFGASLTRRGFYSGVDPDGKPLASANKPGILNKSMIAFSTVTDGIDHASRALLNSGSTAATTVVSHKFGDDAGTMTRHLAGGVKNVGLVYIDAMGVSRKAIVKSVARGMVVGRVKGGGDLIVGGGDGGVVVPQTFGDSSDEKDPLPAQTGTTSDQGPIGFGNGGPPPSYSGPSVGESIEGSRAAPARTKSGIAEYYPPDKR